MPSISEIRKDYTKATLDVDRVAKSPVNQFNNWFAEALKAEVPEPNAMTLSTVDQHGRPSARIVLLKGVEREKFLFYTNYQSQKGKELESNPACALTFFWPELERQVRISGITARVDAKTSERYFQSRPRGSQVGAWASPQSSIIRNRELLEQRVKEIEKRFEGQDLLPKPHQWGGYEVTPFEVEFWQGRSSRLHDRIVYYLKDNEWIIHRLAP
ncbi:MAG: pyridoxamine 5'-phosphate oxidase [Cyclobacteriaceae bacterium]|nr:pyridoxamine 5'-phosphate oxidase [Cyclobacteriaceae bacterium]